MKKQVAKAGVIGCGQIGSWLDERSYSRKSPKTHAGMYHALSQFELVALCDSNKERLAQAKSFWKCPNASTDLDAFLAQPLDIVSICTPPKDRDTLIQKVIAAGIKTIFCEKPLGEESKTIQHIQKMICQKSVQMPINYLRRYDSHLSEMALDIQKGKFGDIQKVVCHYGKGLKNNGSHMLDLLNLFFGTPKSVRAVGRLKDERMSSADPTISAILFYGKLQPFEVYLTAQNHQHFTTFEMDLFFNQKRIVIAEAGRKIKYYKITKDKDFANYLVLTQEAVVKNGMKETFLNAGLEVYQLWQGKKKKPTSTVQNSMELYKVIDAIKRSWATRCKEIFL